MYNSIPKILKDLDIWLCYDDRDKENYKNLSNQLINQNKKQPRDINGIPHSINSRLYSFKECLDSVEKGINSGIGIVLKNNGIVCIDYDNCIDKYIINDKYGIDIPVFKKEIEDNIDRDLELINSYTEISPSGKGIHIYLIANNNIKINVNCNNIEIYTNKFIRVSGKLYNEFLYNEIGDRTEQLKDLIKLYNINLSNDDISKKSVMYKKDNIYKNLLESKFKYNNCYTDKQILDTMFKSQQGAFLKKLYYNTLSDDEYYNYKLNKLNNLLKRKAITQDKYNNLVSKMDLSNSGKSFTLIINLLDFSYGDIDKVYNLFKSSALCRDDYLEKRYSNKTENIIKNQFIPKAITEYVNYR